MAKKKAAKKKTTKKKTAKKAPGKKAVKKKTTKKKTVKKKSLLDVPEECREDAESTASGTSWVENYKELWAGWVRRSMTDNLCIKLKSRSEGNELQLVAGVTADLGEDNFLLWLPYPYEDDPLTRIKFPKAVYQLESWEENVHVTIIVPAEQDAVEISEFLIWYIVEVLSQKPSIVDVDASEDFDDEWMLEEYWNQDGNEIGIPPKKKLPKKKLWLKVAKVAGAFLDGLAEAASKCTACGTKLNPGYRRCHSCGYEPPRIDL